MPKNWTTDQILELAGSYRAACLVAAAADLDLFTALAAGPTTVEDVAAKLRAGRRGTRILLDALAALQLLDKRGDRYTVPTSVATCLTRTGSRTVLSMAQHQANCLRRWVQCARVVRSGKPAERQPSIRGEDADNAAFIGAMDNICAPVAGDVIADIGPLEFTHVLDVGGASGTWTIAFLRAYPDATATIFDLPHVIPMAEQRIADAGLTGRVALVAGDFYADGLPKGADLAWISAICHQNSRAQNRELFVAVREALQPAGQILIRDILMDDSRTSPPAGALFAVNMLVATEGGNSYTFAEFSEDLQDAGFTRATVVRRDEWMNSVVRAIAAS
jgi:hypothetical protein